MNTMVRIECVIPQDMDFLFGFLYGIWKCKGVISCQDLQHWVIEDKLTMKMFQFEHLEEYYDLYHMAEKRLGWTMKALSKVHIDHQDSESVLGKRFFVLPDPDVFIAPDGSLVELPIEGEKDD